VSALVMLPEEHLGETYEDWRDVPNGNVVHVHGKGFYMRVGDYDEALFTGQKNGPTKGWMFYKKIPRGPFRAVSRISYAGT